MIRTYLLVLLTFVLGIGAVAAFAKDAGYVLIHYGSYSIETSVTGLLLAVLLGGGALWLALRLIMTALRLPARLRHALLLRRQNRARRSFEVGLLRFFEGDWARAETDLARRVADHEAPYLNHLAAARAAHRIGALQRRDQYLDLALREGPNAEFAALFARAELAHQDGAHALARDAALKLRARHPRHPEAIALLAESLAALGEWTSLRQLLAETGDIPQPTPPRRAALWSAALCGEIEEARRASQLPRLKSIWEGAGSHRDDAVARLAYIRALIALNAQAEAAAQIEQALTQHADDALAGLYGGLDGIDSVGQLASTEQWLSRYGETPELLLAAGRAATRCHFWGKARGYLDAALRLKPSAPVYLRLAQLCEQTQNPTEAARFYREGLALTSAE